MDSRAHESTHFKQLEREGLIHLDVSEPPKPENNRIELRQESSTELSTASTSSTESSSTTSTEATLTSSSIALSTGDHQSTLASTRTSTSSTQTPVTVIPTPLPSPFDTSIGSNFTSQACPNFFTSFLGDSKFISCVPVSLLLQTSAAFFRAEQDPALLRETLDAACDAPFAECTTYLSSIATQLISSSNCGPDYTADNPLVQRAYNGLVAYAPVYRATCLKDAETGQYCFEEAVSINASSPADPYPYFTALGLSLPTGSRPSCSLCLKQTMDIFQYYAADTNQPLSYAYQGSADEVDAGCGGGFANKTVNAASSTTGGAASLATPPMVSYALAVITVGFLFML